jgi:hypothetical protein
VSGRQLLQQRLLQLNGRRGRLAHPAF